MYENILFDKSDGIATITLNRPDKLNAYTTEMGEEVVAAFRGTRDDDEVRVVVITGAGRGFCAGVDLDHLKAHMAGGNESKGPKLGEEDFLKKMPLEMMEFPKPVIAALNGHAIGVGITMALPCDIRIAADGAKIGLAFAKLGILPGLGSTHVLPRLVGRAKALELVLTAKNILADEAFEIGLVNKVVPGDQLMDVAREMALQMAAHDPAVIRFAKRALHEGAALDMASAMSNEQKLSAKLRESRAKN